MKDAFFSVRDFIGEKMRGERPTNFPLFVQEPDYIAFRKTALPVQALGAVYDGRDPYATPVGIILLVLENNFAREVFVGRGMRAEGEKVAYVHDLGLARYVVTRNGFEEGQMQLGDEPLSSEAKRLIRSYLDMQNSREMNERYLIKVCE